MNLNHKSGFTLVELMVVAVVVAILAAVALALMSGNKGRAAASEAQAGCSVIFNAERIVKVETGSYTNAPAPHSLQGIEPGDLQGKFFDHDAYVTETTANGFTITATANGTDGISGQVIMSVDDDIATWGGSLLE